MTRGFHLIDSSYVCEGNDDLMKFLEIFQGFWLDESKEGGFARKILKRVHYSFQMDFLKELPILCRFKVGRGEVQGKISAVLL